jgi:acyl-[acyl-carrier-protein]-phospholipid O-acyltransferase / long-chain-fatty-acid--[acyl-carrier-protein] ligase
LGDDEAQVAHVNALRVLETSLLHEGDIVLCLVPAEHPMGRTFGVALPKMRDVTVCWSLENLLDALVRDKSGERRIVLIGDAATLTQERLKMAERPYTMTVQLISTAQLSGHLTVANAHPALFDDSSGMLLTLSVPDPELPAHDPGKQLGHKPGSFGHVLPGLVVQAPADGLRFSRLLPPTDLTAEMQGVALDDDGFVVPATSARASVPEYKGPELSSPV